MSAETVPIPPTLLRVSGRRSDSGIRNADRTAPIVCASFNMRHETIVNRYLRQRRSTRGLASFRMEAMEEWRSLLE